MIVGDDWRADEVKPLLASLDAQPEIEAIYVNYNGKKSHVPSWNRWSETPITWARSEWIENFAYSRNLALDMIPMDKYGWWLWVDKDDVLEAPEGLSPLFDALEKNPYVKGATMRYAYSIEPKTGAVVIDQWRERIFSTDWPWAWKWPIHETVRSPHGTPMLRYKGPVFIKHLRNSSEERGTRERNRKIIMRALKEEPNEPRHAYYFANEANGAALHEKDPMRQVMLAEAAIVAWKRYLSMDAPKSPDQEYKAGYHMGELFHVKGDYTGAIDAYLQTARQRPDWPDCWIGCAKACLSLRDWPRMHSFADIAVNLERPETTVALEPHNYDFNPLFLRAIAAEAMGAYDPALVDYTAARKIWDDPNNDLGGRIKALRKKIADQGKKSKPEQQLEKRRGTKPDKSICFFTNPIAEPWNQNTLRAGGHGGAETLVLELAPRFAADGWRVSVFGCPGDAEGIGPDGVEYWKSEDFIPNEPHTVFISSRAAIPFAGPIAAKAKFLWLHDVNIGPSLREVAGQPDAIVPISNWHRTHLHNLYGIPVDKMVVIPNGIDLSLYPEARSDDGHKFIWSSSPDRGLETLLALWPSLRQMMPDATLEVFYGWNYIDKILAQNPGHYIANLKETILNQWESLGAEEAGLVWMGRQPPEVLAKHQLTADIWAYPTNFMETYCLTAVQAQAAGCLPITTDLAALKDNVASRHLRLSGWPRNSDYQTRFLRMMGAIFEDSEPAALQRAQFRREGRAFAETQSVDASYEKWNELIRAVYPNAGR
jgi:glycosyltransferase involved in cell wall biosynthesis